MKNITMGILAHVDSGKTTLSEAMLFKAGNIKKLGRVDSKDAVLDTHNLEKMRGITIFSKQAVLNLNNTEISLLDTPGHIDFSSEMERVLAVLDYAILVINGSDGIQSHTKTLFQLIKKHSIPSFIFINKMDLISADKEKVLQDLKNEFNENCIDFSQNESDLSEKLALASEILLEEFLENQSISTNNIKSEIEKSNIYPCFFGSALKLDGVTEFLEAIDKYTNNKNNLGDFSAKIFKIARDKETRLSYIKIISGELKVKSEINGEKINQIRIYNGEKFENVNLAVAGKVYALVGPSKTYVGQGINTIDDTASIQPILNYSIEILSGQDVIKVFEELKILQDEDPTLNILWNENTKSINIRLMGDIQIEILENVIKERFNIDVAFLKGEILYKETINKPVEGVGHFEPLRHYAEVRLLLEPLEEGEGIILASDCSEDILPRNFQHLIFSNIRSIQHKGALIGAPLTDVKITLVNGRHHIKHTEAGDFREASFRAIQQALRKAENKILEPYYNFKIELPLDNLGRLLSDMQKFRADFSPAEITNDIAILSGKCPCLNLINYNKELISYTKGTGKLSFNVAGFFKAHNEEELIKKYKYNYQEYLYSNPNSVFCENGKGFIVNYEDVEKYAHTPIYLEKEPEILPPQTIKENIAKHYSSFAMDKELLKIFEKTYGKIKTDSFLSFQSPKQTKTTNSIDLVGYTSSDEYLLIDGYNIIFAWDDLKKLANDNIDAARDKLMDIMCNYQGFRQCEVVLVFDAYKVKGGQTSIEKYHNISVVYTKEAETADMYIEKATKKLSKNRKVRVATSDALQQMIILGHGALRVSAKTFEIEVREIEKVIREFCI